jgi:hypothetical protein
MLSRLQLSAHRASSAARKPVSLPSRHGGFAMLLMVFLLTLGVASVGLTFYRPAPTAELADDRTAEVFAEVKTALIGYAARQGVFQCANPGSAECTAALASDAPKLGEFPCPDTDGDGVAEVVCGTAVKRLGRVPWKTLGIPNPKDNAGETLWYAVSRNFLNAASNPFVRTLVQSASGLGNYVSSGALNSSTPGDVTVRAANDTDITTTAIAVIFSPGGALAGQIRSSTVSAPCTVLGATVSVFQHLCPSNYLEAFGTANNAAAPGPYITGTQGDAFNDRLVMVSAGEVMPIVETRLAKELQALLLEYKYNSTCQCYPWADSWSYSGGVADVGINRGRLATKAEPDNWGDGTIPPYPAWLRDNDWNNHLFYIASKNETDKAGKGCLTCSQFGDLQVKRSSAAGAPVDPAGMVLITPGTPRPGVNRPFLPATLVVLNSPFANVFASYFEDTDNNKTNCPGNAAEHAADTSGVAKVTAPDSCDTLIRPESRGYDRDRLWAIAAETPATMCPKAGLTLLNNTPCKLSGNTNKPICDALVTKLQQCSTSCQAAASEMIRSPCRSDQSSSQCPPFYAALRACTS